MFLKQEIIPFIYGFGILQLNQIFTINLNYQLVTADGSNQSDNCSEMPHSEIESRVGKLEPSFLFE